ncbi:MAG TPA: homoprotocatechuate degradation operon regulator HpaR [Rhodanobacter sp.]|jgi:homoprotocatechuate degradation operon regulator, HpaR
MPAAPSHLTQPSRVPANRGDVPPEALPYRNLPMLLLRAREKLMLRFRPILTAHGLTEQQWRVIRALNEHGPLESRHIADLCTISTPSMAGVLARMEAKDWVSKTRLAHDQRRVRVALTARSRKLVSSIASDLQAAYVELERRVGPRLLAETYHAVDGLLAGIEAEATR